MPLRPTSLTPATTLAQAVDGVLRSAGRAATDAGIDPSALRWAAARLVVQHLVRERAGASAAAALALPLGLDPARRAALGMLAAHEPATLAGLPTVAFADLGACYPTLLSHGERKRSGAWFTGRELADPTTHRALSPLLDQCRDPATLRIVDPAVGAGTFLLAALQTLTTAGLPAPIAAMCLGGVDVDPTAAMLAALSLWEACGDERPDLAAITADVRCGDGLAAFADGSFDAVLGNPPWETLQPSRHEITRDRAVSGGLLPLRFHDQDTAFAAQRTRSAALRTELRPGFSHQGRGKLFTYRLFVERAIRLLRPGGRFGLLVPASLLFDREARSLRELLLDQCDWQWSFGFENKKQLFAIDNRYRFTAIVGSRGGPTAAVRVAFGQTDPAAWASEQPPHLRYERSDLHALSPTHHTFVAIDNGRDLELLRAIGGAGRPLLGRRGAAHWRQGDCNMTSARARFVPLAAAEADGYRRCDDAVWRRRADETALLPLWQGAMIYDLHPNVAVHAHGTGHRTRWAVPAQVDELRPQFLLPSSLWTGPATRQPARIGLRALANASNERSAVAALLPPFPCGNSLGVLQPHDPGPCPLRATAALAGVLGSLPFDWALRQRLVGTNLNQFVLADTVVPELTADTATRLAVLVLRLSGVLPWQARCWDLARDEGWLPPDHRQRNHVALDHDDRTPLLVELDLLVARAFGLDADDLAWMLRDCDHDPELLRDRRFTGTLPPRGFWRIDRTLAPPLRRTTRLLAAARLGIGPFP